jgi:hypothetical protein
MILGRRLRWHLPPEKVADGTGTGGGEDRTHCVRAHLVAQASGASCREGEAGIEAHDGKHLTHREHSFREAVVPCLRMQDVGFGDTTERWSRQTVLELLPSESSRSIMVTVPLDGVQFGPFMVGKATAGKVPQPVDRLFNRRSLAPFPIKPAKEVVGGHSAAADSNRYETPAGCRGTKLRVPYGSRPYGILRGNPIQKFVVYRIPPDSWYIFHDEDHWLQTFDMLEEPREEPVLIVVSPSSLHVDH